MWQALSYKPHAPWGQSAGAGTPALLPHVPSAPSPRAWGFGDTHDPSTPIRGHVTEDFQSLGLIAVQINGVEARGRVSVQHCLGAVPGEWVQESNWGVEERVMSEQGDWGGSLWISALLLVGWMTDPP